MTQAGGECLQHEGAAALRLMELALELLDQCNGAFDVGAHLDLAICRLRELFEKDLAVEGQEQEDLAV